ncbi:hypothetical protein T265_15573, partial [Opisthorchis viverrini]
MNKSDRRFCKGQCEFPSVISLRRQQWLHEIWQPDFRWMAAKYQQLITMLDVSSCTLGLVCIGRCFLVLRTAAFSVTVQQNPNVDCAPQWKQFAEFTPST